MRLCERGRDHGLHQSVRAHPQDATPLAVDLAADESRLCLLAGRSVGTSACSGAARVWRSSPPACTGWPASAGISRAPTKVFAADGGEWCWSIHQRYFAAATGILDWFQASEHVWTAAHARHPEDDQAARQWAAEALEQRHESGGTGLLNWLLDQRSPLRGKRRTAVEALITDIQTRQDRTDYPDDKEADLQIGTGDRIDSPATRRPPTQSPGMHWTEAGALAITALRAHDLNENGTTSGRPSHSPLNPTTVYRLHPCLMGAIGQGGSSS